MPAERDSTSARCGSSPIAEIASSDDSTNTLRCCAAASARSSLQTRRTLARVGSCGAGSCFTSVTSLLHSARSSATSSGGTLTVSASCAALEAAEELLHRRKGLPLVQQARFLELVRDLRYQLAAEPADVGERGEHPHRRRS